MFLYCKAWAYKIPAGKHSSDYFSFENNQHKFWIWIFIINGDTSQFSFDWANKMVEQIHAHITQGNYFFVSDLILPWLSSSFQINYFTNNRNEIHEITI